MDTKKIKREIPSKVKDIEAGTDAANYIRGVIEKLPDTQNEIVRIRKEGRDLPIDAVTSTLNYYIDGLGTMQGFNANIETILQAFERLLWFIDDLKTEIEDQ